MALVGEAYVDLHSQADNYGTEVEAQSKAALGPVAADADAAGLLAGENLRSGVGKGLDDVEKDAEDSGKKAGGFLQSGIGNALSGLSGAFGGIGGDLGALGGSLDAAGSKVEGLSTKSAGLMGTLTTLGTGIAVGGVAAFAAFSVASVDMAQKFDSTVTSIAANANIPVSAAKKIGDAFLSTAGSTIFGAGEIATAYASVAGQAGQLQGKALTAAQALALMKVAMDLAEGSGSSLGSATSTLTTVLQTFRLGLSSASTASDILFNSARATGTGIDATGAALDKLHSSLGANAPSLAQTAGLMLDLKNSGETGRQAVSGVSTALSSMVDPTTKAQQAMAFLGINLKDAQGNFIGIGPALDMIKGKIGDNSNSQALLAAALGITGKQAAQLLPIIEQGSAGFDKSTASVSKAGSAQDAAAKQSTTLGHEMDTLKATIGDLATKWGNELIPKLETFGKAILSVSKYVIDHKALLITLAAIVGTVVVAALAAATVALISFIAPMLLAALTIAPLVLAIAGLALAAVYLATHWKQVWADIKNWFDDAVKFLRSGFGTLVLLITGPIAPLLFLALHWQQIWNDIKNWTSSAWNFIKGIINDLVSFFTGIPGKIDHVWSDVVNAIHAAWSAVVNWVSSNVITPLVNFFTSLPGKVDHVFMDILNTWENAWKTIGTWVYSNVIQPVIQFYEQIPGRVAHVFSDVANALEGAWNVIATWVYNNVISPVINFFAQIPGQVHHVWSDVVNAISSAWGTIATWVDSNVIQPVINFFTQIPGDVTGIASQVFSNFTSGLSTIGNWVLSNVVDPVVNFIKGIPGKIAGIGGDIVDAIVKGISAGAGKILSAIKSIIPGPLQSALNFIGLAEGGLVTSPTIALVGEAGPELVIPLSKLDAQFQTGIKDTPTQLMSNLTSSSGRSTLSGGIQQAVAVMGGPASGANAGQGVNVTIEAGAFAVNVYGAADPGVAGAASTAVEQGYNRMTQELRAGVNPLRDLSTS